MDSNHDVVSMTVIMQVCFADIPAFCVKYLGGWVVVEKQSARKSPMPAKEQNPAAAAAAAAVGARHAAPLQVH